MAWANRGTGERIKVRPGAFRALPYVCSCWMLLHMCVPSSNVSDLPPMLLAVAAAPTPPAFAFTEQFDAASPMRVLSLLRVHMLCSLSLCALQHNSPQKRPQPQLTMPLKLYPQHSALPTTNWHCACTIAGYRSAREDHHVASRIK